MNDPSATSRFAHDRERMIANQLVARGIRDEHVLAAFRKTPREAFMQPQMREFAYSDAAFPIDCGQTISQPYMVACMTESLSLRPADRVLEIGTGSGYQTAILAHIAKHVYTIEWHDALQRQARRRLNELGFSNITYHCGDGSVGWKDHAPFDAIIVTAGAPDIPDTLCKQLNENGRLVIPVGSEFDQCLVRIVKRHGDLHRTVGIACRFVKLVGREGWHVV